MLLLQINPAPNMAIASVFLTWTMLTLLRPGSALHCLPMHVSCHHDRPDGTMIPEEYLGPHTTSNGEFSVDGRLYRCCSPSGRVCEAASCPEAAPSHPPGDSPPQLSRASHSPRPSASPLRSPQSPRPSTFFKDNWQIFAASAPLGALSVCCVFAIAKVLLSPATVSRTDMGCHGPCARCGGALPPNQTSCSRCGAPTAALVVMGTPVRGTVVLGSVAPPATAPQTASHAGGAPVAPSAAALRPQTVHMVPRAPPAPEKPLSGPPEAHGVPADGVPAGVRDDIVLGAVSTCCLGPLGFPVTYFCCNTRYGRSGASFGCSGLLLGLSLVLFGWVVAVGNGRLATLASLSGLLGWDVNSLMVVLLSSLCSAVVMLTACLRLGITNKKRALRSAKAKQLRLSPPHAMVHVSAHAIQPSAPAGPAGQEV